jgi:hypothetical protein
MAPRRLTVREREVILALMKGSPRHDSLAQKLGEFLVTDMEDGGMGSIKFLYDDAESRDCAYQVAEAAAEDEDGVPISLALHLDQHGDPFELDIWKVDFSPLIRYPCSSDLTILKNSVS